MRGTSLPAAAPQLRQALRALDTGPPEAAVLVGS